MKIWKELAIAAIVMLGAGMLFAVMANAINRQALECRVRLCEKYYPDTPLEKCLWEHPVRRSGP